MAKPLPPQPDLEHLKKQAKVLLKSYQAAQPDTLQRIQQYHPRLQTSTDEAILGYDFKLADAQLVIAREYGFASWPRLKANVQSLNGSLEDRVEQFRNAVNTGNVDKVKQLFRQSPALKKHINEPIFHFGGEALHAAGNHREMVDVLLKNGADINAKSEWWAGGFTPLISAEPDFANYLIERGADVDIHAAAKFDMLERVEALLNANPALVHAEGGDGQRPLHFATTPRVMDVLLKYGAEIDARDNDHESTAAQWAVNNPQKCRYLIEHGAQVDIFMACVLGDGDLVQQVLDADPEAIDARIGADGYDPVPIAPGGHIYIYEIGAGFSPYQVATKVFNPQLYAYLLERSSLQQQFIAACERTDEQAVQSILSQQPDIVKTLPEKHKRLLADMAWNNNLRGVRMLLDAGFDPNVVSVHNSTPLDRAAFHGFVTIVKLLLEQPNPPIHMLNEFGGTPLGAAMAGIRHSWRHDGDFPATVEALIQAGCTIKPQWLPTGNGDVDAVISKYLSK